MAGIGTVMFAAAIATMAGPFVRNDPKSVPFTGPAKMVVFSDGVAVTDYPSQQKCEAARVALERAIDKANASNPPVALPNGGVVSTLPMSARTLCIPG
jgi:hypothetical protein